MTTLFDKLGIDETDGVTPDEIESIKRSLDKMRVVGSQVAKKNPAPRTQAILDRVNEKLEALEDVKSVEDVDAMFAGGSLNGTKSVAPFGAGSTTDPGAALMTVTLTADENRLLDGMRNPTSGQQHAMRRLFNDGDAQHIPVEDDGTPSEIAKLRKEVKDLTKERDEALKDLAEERNESQDGSLAKKLKDAMSKSLPPAPADMVEKAKVKSATDAVKDAVGKLSSPMMSKTIEGKSALDKAVDELDKLAK